VFRQVHYIFYAAGLLIACTGSFFLINQIPSEIAEQDNKGFCGTENPVERILSENEAKGKTLFMRNCASCHALFKNMTGPSLVGFEDRGPWGNRDNLYQWIRSPEAFIKKNEYARELKSIFNGLVMTAFPDMTTDEMDAIAAFLNPKEPR
jgi:cytochrome c2